MKTLQINHQRHVFGKQDRFINTCLKHRSMPSSTATTNVRLLKELTETLFSFESYDLLIVRCLGPYKSPWSIVGAGKRVFRWLLYLIAVKYKLSGARIAVLDHTDHVTIHPADKKLLGLCDIYFKRELARNTWNTFEAVLPHGTCIEHVTENLGDYHSLKDKLRPVSLGFHKEISQVRPERKYDFFYVGMERGIAERIEIKEALLALREKGYKVYLPDHTLTPKEFSEAMESSWFCPSPMGCGWDCYRHYEILAYGSIPLISSPSIHAYHPVGSHNKTGITIDYDGDLVAQLEACLSVPIEQRLSIIGNGQQHIKSHHFLPAIGDYMVKELSEIPELAATDVLEVEPIS